MGDQRVIRILAMVASHTGMFSNTYRLAQAVLQGARAAHPAIEEEFVFLSDHDVRPSTGCITCLRKGYCPQQDDVPRLQERILAADGIIFGSPVYMLHVSAQAKAFLDRCLGWAHRPPLQGKYVVTIASSLGLGGDLVNGYLAQVWTSFGAQVVGSVEGQAIIKGMWLNREQVLEETARAGCDLVRAILERPVLPVPDFERERFERFRQLIHMPVVGAKLFRADQEFWRQREGREPSHGAGQAD